MTSPWLEPLSLQMLVFILQIYYLNVSFSLVIMIFENTFANMSILDDSKDQFAESFLLQQSSAICSIVVKNGVFILSVYQTLIVFGDTNFCRCPI